MINSRNRMICRRLLPAFFLLMTFILINNPVCAADVLTDGAFTVRVENGEASVTGWSGTEKELIIPDTLAGYPVTSIGRRAFDSRNGEQIVSLKIADTVETIEDDAFAYCYRLKNLELPRNLRSIGERAFDETYELKALHLPRNLSFIGDNAFSSLYDCEEITLEQGNTSFVLIGGALYTADRKELVMIPGQLRVLEVEEGTETIRNSACRLNNNVWGSGDPCFRVLILPKSLKTIGSDAFMNRLYDGGPVYYRGTEEELSQIKGLTYLLSQEPTVNYNYQTEKVEGIDVLPKTATLYEEGDSVRLSAATVPNSVQAPVKWASSNENVATVRNGVVYPVNGGTCKVSATAGEYSADCQVTVIGRNTLSVTGGSGSGSYFPDTIVTIRADEAPSGKKFSYWNLLRSVSVLDGGSVTDSEIRISMPDFDTTITAVYEDAEEDPGTEQTGEQGTNVETQEYSSYSSNVISSYLSVQDDGYMRVQNLGNGLVLVEYYDKDFKFRSSKYLKKELSIFGGFFETGSNYFILTGQPNYGQSSHVECFRLTKYTKSWERIDSVGLFDCNTYLPFRSGSARFASSGKYVYIHASHMMYDKGDDVHHQANVMMKVDTESMQITASATDVLNSAYGYVSHSFNQFIVIDDGKVVTFDHGDAHPRAGYIYNYENDIPDGTIGFDDMGWYGNGFSVISFKGETGQNSTGATFGGFLATQDKYLVAGTSIDQSESSTSKTANVFLISASKDGSAKDTVWLTENGGRTPHLIDLQNGQYLIMWSRTSDNAGSYSTGQPGWYEGNTVYYQFIDSAGNLIGDMYQAKGALSDCVPVVDDGKVVWYTWKDSYLKFYSIDLNNPQSIAICDQPIVLNSLKADPGKVFVRPGKSGKINITFVPEDYDGDRTITWISADRSIATVDSDGLVTGHACGKTVITAKVGKKSVTVPVYVYEGDYDYDVYEDSVIVFNGSTYVFEKVYLIAVSGYTGESVQPEIPSALYGDPVEVIGPYAFSGKNIKSIMIPSDIHFISYYVFSNCRNLKKVYYEGSEEAWKKIDKYSSGNSYMANAEFFYNYNKLQNVAIIPETSRITEIGGTIQLKGMFDPEDTSDQELVWTSADENIATVDENGLVTAVSLGTTEISAVSFDQSVTAKASVTVVIPVETASFKDEKIRLLTDTVMPELLIEPSNAGPYKIAWSSSDENVVKVDENGVVKKAGVGKASLKAVIAGIYTLDEKPIELEIPVEVPRLLTDEGIEISLEEEWEYTGSQIKPEVQITDGEKVLNRGEEDDADYEVVYPADAVRPKYKDETGTEYETYSITLIGKGDYAGEVIRPFTIVRRKLTGEMVTVNQDEFVYNGQEQKPEYQVQFAVGEESVTLAENADYVLSGDFGTDAGTYVISVSAAKDSPLYEGTVDTSYSITPKPFTEEMFSLSEELFTYTGTVQQPEVILKDGEQQIPADEFSVKVSPFKKDGVDNAAENDISDAIESIDAGTYLISAEALRNYSGTLSGTFIIEPLEITEEMIVPSTNTLVYNGTAQAPQITLEHDQVSFTLEEGSIDGRSDAGTYSYEINSAILGPNYKGSVTKSFTITPLELSQSMLKLEPAETVYNMASQSPVITVGCTDPELVLAPGTDYDLISDGTGTDVGSYDVELSGKGNYKGTLTGTFTIREKTLTDEMISLKPESVVYNGGTQSPEVSVKENGTVFEENTHFTVLIPDAPLTDAGEYKIAVTGTGNCTGTIEKTFRILPVKMKDISMTPLEDEIYTGIAIKKENCTVSARKADDSDGTAIMLREGSDYQITYLNNIHVSGEQNGKAEAKVTLTGNYTSDEPALFYFNILPKPLSAEMAVFKDAYAYTGSSIQPELVLKEGKTLLTPDADYRISFNEIKEAGDEDILVAEGIGDYTGVLNLPYHVVPRDLKDVIFEKPADVQYTGQAVNPVISGTLGSLKLVSGKDFDIKVINNTAPGTATVTAAGKGNFTGQQVLYFRIFEKKAEEKPTQTPVQEKQDPAKQLAADGTAVGAGASEEAAKDAILRSTSDEGPSGSRFSILQAQAKKVKKNSISLKWKKIPGAKYVVYGNKCGKKFEKITDVSGTSYTQKGLNKGTYYKYLVMAVKDGKVVSSSKTLHIATSGGKVGNNTKVTINRKKITLKAGKSKKLKAKAKKGKKKVKKHRAIKWESSNPAVATVNSSGKVKAVGKGKAIVYAYAQNGKFAKCTVTVKNK